MDPSDEDDDIVLDDGPEAETKLRSQGYSRPQDVATSSTEVRLVYLLDPENDVAVELALSRYREHVNNSVAEALSEERQNLRQANRKIAGADEAGVASYLEKLSAMSEELVVVFRAEWRSGADYIARASADIMQSAATTAAAIGLLLQHGYVLDAEARWRGIHELACSAALLEQSPDSELASQRYLAHGRILPADDPAYGESWATRPNFFDRDAEWLRVDHPHLSKKGEPLRFQQSWIFQKASLSAAPFAEWIKPSHAVVHMSDIAVRAGREQAGAAPAGYDPRQSELVAWRSACSLYELVAHLCSMMIKQEFPAELALAWMEKFRSVTSEGRPGWVIED